MSIAGKKPRKFRPWKTKSSIKSTARDKPTHQHPNHDSHKDRRGGNSESLENKTKNYHKNTIKEVNIVHSDATLTLKPEKAEIANAENQPLLSVINANSKPNEYQKSDTNKPNKRKLAPTQTTDAKWDNKQSKKFRGTFTKNEGSTESTADRSMKHSVSAQKSISVYKLQTVYPTTDQTLVSKFKKLGLKRFITDSDGEDYTRLLKTSYKGFVVDSPSQFDEKFHYLFAKSLLGLEDNQIYSYDVTQPLGLNTKLAKTYVTRCLVGIPGITYKYLGLRMFAIPWTEGEVGATAESIQIGILNQQLTERTKALLNKDNVNSWTDDSTDFLGSCVYNLTLINRCFPASNDLKNEPMFDAQKCAVSWHADSSLEHFSSIAVYHHTYDGSKDPTDLYKVALRVQHDAEGPNAGKLKSPGTKNSIASGSDVPAVSVPLPDKHAYYLLHDFNHHHQHAVIAGNMHRISSTHRVGRLEGHTFDDIRNKCNNALHISNKSIGKQKNLRSVITVWIDLEFEWIRQFYIQGSHHESVHSWWKNPMKELTRYAEQLWQKIQYATQALYDASIGETETQSKMAKETSTPNVTAIDDAADASLLDQDGCKNHNESLKKRKKLAQKRLQALKEVEQPSFGILSEFFADLHKKRLGWEAREKDEIFKTLPKNCRPMSVPSILGTTIIPLVMHESDKHDKTYIESLAQSISDWRRRYDTQKR